MNAALAMAQHPLLAPCALYARDLIFALHRVELQNCLLDFSELGHAAKRNQSPAILRNFSGLLRSPGGRRPPSARPSKLSELLPASVEGKFHFSFD